MSSRVYETISRHACGPFQIRVWYMAKIFTFCGESSPEVLALIAEWRERIMFEPACPLTPHEMRDRLADLPGVAAVEVADENGSGILAYNDWP